MSYILQALEKSEKQRQQTQQVEQSAPSTGPQQNNNSSLKVYLGALFLILMLTPVALILVSQSAPSVPVTPKVVASESVVSEVGSSKVAGEEGVKGAVKDVAAAKIISQLQPVIKPSTEVERAGSASKVLSIYELDKAQLIKVPPIIVSSHIFSSAPEYRKVTINGQGYIEGQAMSADLRLISIGKQELIFDFDGQQITVPALKGWQP